MASSTFGVISRVSCLSLSWVAANLLLSQKMGPQAHFGNRSKRGLGSVARRVIGPFRAGSRTGSESVQHDRHRAVVHEFDRHARAEHASLDVRTFCRELLAEPLIEGIRLLGRSRPREAGAVALPRVLSLSEVNRKIRREP